MKRLIKHIVFEYIFYVNKLRSFNILKSAVECGDVRELSGHLNLLFEAYRVLFCFILVAGLHIVVQN